VIWEFNILPFLYTVMIVPSMYAASVVQERLKQNRARRFRVNNP